METLVQSCRSAEEYKYILSNLINFTIERIANMSQSENELKREVQALSQTVEDMKGMHMTLNEDEINDILEMTKSASPQGENVNPAAKTKLRRRTSTPNDLLYGGPSVEKSKSACNLTPVPEDSYEYREALKDVNVGNGALVRADDAESVLSSVEAQPSSSMDVTTGDTRRLAANPTDRYQKLEGHEKTGVTTLDTYGDILMSGGRDHFIRAWDLRTHVNHWSVHAHAYTVNHVALASDERIVASAAAFSTRIYDIRDNQECLKVVQSSGLVEEMYVEKKFKKNEIPKSETMIEGLAWDPDGFFLYIATRNYFRVWDLRCLRCVGCFVAPVSSRIQNIKVVPYQDDSHVRVLVNHKMRDDDTQTYLYSYIGDVGSIEFSSTAIPVNNGLTQFAATDRNAFVCTTDGKMNRYSLIDSAREAQVWSPDGSNFTHVAEGVFNGERMVCTATETGIVNTWEYGGQQSMIQKDSHDLQTEVKCMAANSNHGTLYVGTNQREILKII
uniref:WD repeat-containing protein 55 homolog n=2 Tax=Panagrellus redivivus TaxID=6233 RepID=A0A7E4VS98_PANRE